MSQEDAKIFVSLSDFVLQQDLLLTALAKLMMVRFQNLEDTRRMRAQLEQMPDSDNKQAIAESLSALEQQVDSSAETRALQNLLAVRRF